MPGNRGYRKIYNNPVKMGENGGKMKVGKLTENFENSTKVQASVSSAIMYRRIEK